MAKVIIFLWFLYICYQVVWAMVLTFCEDEDEDLEEYLAKDDAAITACMKAMAAAIVGAIIGFAWILFFSGGMR